MTTQTATKVETLARQLRSLYEEVATLFAHADELVQNANAAEGIKGAEVLFYEPVRKLAARIRELGITNDPDWVSPDDLQAICIYVNNLLVALGQPKLPEVKHVEYDRWLDEMDGVNYKYVDEAVFPEVNGIRPPMQRSLAAGKYHIAINGRLAKV